MLFNKYKPFNLFDRLAYVFSLMISLLIIAPIFVMILGNIGTDNEYFRFFSQTEFINYTKNSLLILISVLFITFVLGTFSRYLVSFYEFPFVNFLNTRCCYLLQSHHTFLVTHYQDFLKIMEHFIQFLIIFLMKNS